MSDTFNEKVVVITGGSSGLGAALAAHFAGKGLGVCVNYISESRGERAESELLAVAPAGSSAVIKCKADVADRNQVRAMFDAVIEKFGRVDMLINSAGRNRDAPFLELTDEHWDSVIASHLRGHFVCSQEFVFHSPDNEGLIINFAAPCGIEGRENGANFCSAKGGILALTKCMALELAPRIRVNCVIPGSIKTREVMERYNLESESGLEVEPGRIPMNRLGELDDLLRMVDGVVGAKFSTRACFSVNGGQFM